MNVDWKSLQELVLAVSYPVVLDKPVYDRLDSDLLFKFVVWIRQNELTLPNVGRSVVSVSDVKSVQIWYAFNLPWLNVEDQNLSTSLAFLVFVANYQNLIATNRGCIKAPSNGEDWLDNENLPLWVSI